MRLGTHNTVIVVGANLSLLRLVLVAGHIGPEHRRLPENAPVPARLHGHHCYRLEFTHPNWASYLTPHDVELVDSILGIDPAWRRAWLRDPDGLFSRWRMAGADSIDMILLTEGAIGVVVRVSTKGDTLTGRAWPAYDSPPQPWEPPDASARAVPILCGRATRAARRALSERS